MARAILNLISALVAQVGPLLYHSFDTAVLVALSVKDFLLSQHAPQTGLQIRPGVPSAMAGHVEQPLKLATPAETANVSGGGSSVKVSRFDPNFTDNVIKATGPKASPRVRTVMASLIRHLHDFCRENEITVDEYMAATHLVPFMFFRRRSGWD